MDEVQVADSAGQGTEAPVAGTETVIEGQGSEAPAAEAPKEAPPPEKMIPQSQVSKIAAREARQAAEKARNEVRQEYERLQVQQAAAPEQPASQMGGIPQMSSDQVQQLVMQAAHRISTQTMADQMAKDFESKIKAEIDADPDFGDLYDSLNIGNHPELVIWMNGMDNSAKVVKDLANNPTKFANILMLAKSGMPQLAQKELSKLHDSIKVNQAALAQPKAKEPLDQLSPSSVGVGNGENMSVSDYQKQSWLRG